MTDSDLTTALVDTLAGHPEGWGWPLTCKGCDWRGFNHAEHVAAVLRERYDITEKGQLRQEWTWSWDTGYPPPHEKGYGYPVDSREEAAAEADSYMEIVARLVSLWRVVDGQEKP